MCVYKKNPDLNRSGRSQMARRHSARKRRRRLFTLCLLLAAVIASGSLLGNLRDNTSGTGGADANSWSLILVNKWNPVPKDYEVQLTQLSCGESVDSRIYPALQKMFDDAREKGVYPVVASGYRTAAQQQRLLDQKIQDYKNEGLSKSEAKEKAREWVAPPGTSEHQLGIAVDINADKTHSSGDKVYQWLDKNACKYGFIRRYPPDKTDITGVINEPWHYRYVGVDAATEIQKQGVCLEEYLGQD